MRRGAAVASGRLAWPVKEPTDFELVGAVRRGDDRAFELLYDRHHRRIAAYVHRMVGDEGRSEDVTQEVFISALRRMRETERPIAFQPWIYEIARNACIDHFRRRLRASECSYDSGEPLADADQLRLLHAGAPEPDVALARKQALHDLCGAIGELSEVHHRIIVLRELEGLSYREIADGMGLSAAAVESTLFRARRRLNEEYRELASGERCRRIRAVIGSGETRPLGVRERRRVARHISRCSPCRRHAHQLGVDETLRPPLAARLAALLPLPALLRHGGAGIPRGGSSTWLGQWSGTLAAGADQIAASGAKLVTAGAIALATVGTGVAVERSTTQQPSASRAAAARAPGLVAPPGRLAPRAVAVTGDGRVARVPAGTTPAVAPLELEQRPQVVTSFATPLSKRDRRAGREDAAALALGNPRPDDVARGQADKTPPGQQDKTPPGQQDKTTTSPAGQQDTTSVSPGQLNRQPNKQSTDAGTTTAQSPADTSSSTTAPAGGSGATGPAGPTDGTTVTTTATADPSQTPPPPQ